MRSLTDYSSLHFGGINKYIVKSHYTYKLTLCALLNLSMYVLKLSTYALALVAYERKIITCLIVVQYV